MLRQMRYRLALDLGTNSIGWCMLRLDHDDTPCAVIRAGVRIFSDGRNPKDGSSLAVTRRLARQMRRRRDRLLKRKARLAGALIRHGFWPEDAASRKALERLDPYALRRDGLDKPLSPQQFGRALFHLNQRRGFQSNRRTDRKDAESGLLKSAIRRLREALVSEGARTVGEWLARRHERRESVRARLRGTSARERAYDLYIDRSMIADEFDTLWAAQAAFSPDVFTENKRRELRDILLYQRPLRPVRPGRCTLLPDEERAPIALPSVQRFRVFQELNNLRLIDSDLSECALSRHQRDTLASLLDRGDVTFAKMRRTLGLPGHIEFNLADIKRDKLKGNATSKALSHRDCFGEAWYSFSAHLQDEIVEKLIGEPSESVLIEWLMQVTGVEESAAEHTANVGLAEGYASLSRVAISRVLPELQREVVSFAEAVRRAGFDSHSVLSRAETTGEIFESLPYYGEALQRHVGFADPDAAADAPPERRFGRIANPTVHIGLNELRKVVNGLLKRYGHPSEVVVEVARELKQSQEWRRLEQERQAERQAENERLVALIQSLPGRAATPVRGSDLQRARLWVELNPRDATNRRCPYTGEQISLTRLFSDEVEIEHILPFSRTLDDSLNNKTVSLRRANRDKANLTPYEAFGHSPAGYDYNEILARASLMPRDKAKRFAADGYARWLRDDKDFLARALTDTAYLSRIAKEYLSLICPPQRVRVVPGRLTALLRGKFGLNDVLSLSGEKNRQDHRHHAVDAAVIGVTDQGLLQRFAQASADARQKQIGRLVESMPLPWPTYREHVSRAVMRVIVSHRPDHAHEGALHNDTAYGLRPDGVAAHRVMLDSFRSRDDIARRTFADAGFRQLLLDRTEGLSGKEFAARLDTIQRETGRRRVRLLERLQVIPMREQLAVARHGMDTDGQPKPYKGYKGDSNYCIEIWRDDRGAWRWSVISTFEAHRIEREAGVGRLRHPRLAANGRPLVMRLVKGDYVKADFRGATRLMQVCKIKSSGSLFIAEHFEANVRQREEAKDPSLVYGAITASGLRRARARQVTVSPIGDVRDPGFSA